MVLITQDDVQMKFSYIGPMKTLGLKGFNAHFFQKKWRHLGKKNLSKMIQELFSLWDIQCEMN